MQNLKALPQNNLIHLKNVWGLGLQLAKAEFKLRNEGSYLGILWYLLNPILMFGILYFIFEQRLGNGVLHYPTYLLLGIILFNIFQATTTEAARCILKEHHYLVKSIHFPRESLVLSILLKNIFAHIFEIALFIGLLMYTHVSLIGLLYYIPFLCIYSLFIYGTSLLLASLTVHFADLDNIWNFASRIIWFGTPIFYIIENQPALLNFNLANPLYYFLTLGRDLVIYQQVPSALILIGSIAFSLGFLGLGLLIFKKLERNFAELI